MFFKTRSALALLVATGLVAAAPLVVERQTTTTPPDRYYLQTKVVGNLSDTGSNKTDLWLYSYHTGAGLGDAALSSNKTYAWEGYLNGTDALFVYPNEQYLWPLAVTYGAYQSWTVTTLGEAEQPTSGSPGFYFNATGLQYNATGSGWLVCDWWHGVPQLFALSNYLYGPIPSTCSQVELYPIAV